MNIVQPPLRPTTGFHIRSRQYVRLIANLIPGTAIDIGGGQVSSRLRAGRGCCLLEHVNCLIDLFLGQSLVELLLIAVSGLGMESGKMCDHLARPARCQGAGANLSTIVIGDRMQIIDDADMWAGGCIK